MSLRAYPRDFAAFARYNPALRRLPGPRFPLPAPLSVDALDEFLAEVGAAYPVDWIDVPATPHTMSFL